MINDVILPLPPVRGRAGGRNNNQIVSTNIGLTCLRCSMTMNIPTPQEIFK